MKKIVFLLTFVCAMAGFASAQTYNGHAYVDLGLPSGTLWATCNVGASKPTDYGNYYAWGETKTKTSFFEENYSFYGTPSTLPLYSDAANASWGGAWRMPTKSEFDELMSYCNWNKTSDGFYVTGPNGRSIFLPAAGNAGGRQYAFAGFYWSSTIDAKETKAAFALFFYEFTFETTLRRIKEVDEVPRWIGFTIRPVFKR